MFTPTRLRNAARQISQRTFSSESTSIKDEVRTLLRETAQHVAVVTSSSGSLAQSASQHPYHGATLSSFTSIALDPFPLVAFSLRIPSRMAASLKTSPTDPPPSLVVNLLSANHASTAIIFSRPDLYPDPFSIVDYTLNEEGTPLISKTLGALSCRLVSVLPLHDLEFLQGPKEVADVIPAAKGSSLMSELFIARVTRVERRIAEEGDISSSLPLIYHRRGYTSCQ